jgi:membrane-associated phospholipid phosphatase
MGDSRESLHVPGSIVRGILLIALVTIVAPAVVATGDTLAVPSVALVLLAAIAVAVVGLLYWLVTVGALAGWAARSLELTPDRVAVVLASVIGVTAAAGLAWFRLELRHRRTPLSQFDLRAVASATRLNGEHQLMQTLNTVGIRSMLVLATMLVVAAIVVRSFRSAALLAATMALGGGLVELFKSSPLRPVPALGEAASRTTSFPSGHAALQCSLAFGIVLWWWAAGLPRASVVAAIVFPFAVLVGYSRAFLDIHLLSDVLAGWLVAVIAAAIVVIADRLLSGHLAIPGPPGRWRVIAAGVAAVSLACVAVGVDRQIHDRAPRHFPNDASGPVRGFRGFAAPAAPTRLPTAATAAMLGVLPRFSETLLGRPVQPIGVVVVARDDQLGVAMERAGWRPAQELTPERLPRDLWSGLMSWTGLVGGVGAGEPITPTFYDGRAPDIVARRGSADAELWQLPVETPGGCVVWGVTTARDQGTTIGRGTLIPRRRIATSIDAERDALARALAAGGALADTGRYAFIGPHRESGSRGPFVTDGKVALLRQPGC